ncbi:uncharacterized protein P884DRAFT_5242 [Thermothelomyces heterothallicus CBS 202.75]|uniref:uncharacterized protein n=1 Tax=Thermothelomyces heterothallicus CBS 202.75 TaxID=1149848 RepID=UPI003743E23D
MQCTINTLFIPGNTRRPSSVTAQLSSLAHKNNPLPFPSSQLRRDTRALLLLPLSRGAFPPSFEPLRSAHQLHLPTATSSISGVSPNTKRSHLGFRIFASLVRNCLKFCDLTDGHAKEQKTRDRTAWVARWLALPWMLRLPLHPFTI